EGAVAVADLRSPAFPKEIASLPLADPRDLEVRGTRAYIAAGKDGLVIVDVEKADRPRAIGHADLGGDARKLALAGFYAYVLDAADTGAMHVVDVADPAKPKVVATVKLDDEGRDATAEEPGSIVTWWSWSRPTARGRTPARRLVAIATTKGLLALIDATEPTKPRLYPRPRERRLGDKASVRALAIGRSFDLGSEGGGIPSI